MERARAPWPGSRRCRSGGSSARRASTGPSTSEARMNSSRLSSLICPVRVSHCIAAIHSASVSRTSRAKSCRWRTSAVMISREPRVVRGAPARRGELGDVVLGDELHLDSSGPRSASSARSSAAAPAMARILPSAALARQVLHPAVRGDHEPLRPAGTGTPGAPARRRPRPSRPRRRTGRSRPRMIVLSDRSASTPRSSPDCAVSIEIWSTGQPASSGRNE